MHSKSFQEYPADLAPILEKLLGCGALREMRKKLRPVSNTLTGIGRYETLERLVVDACAFAAVYRPGTDYYDKHRRRETDFFADLAGGISAGQKFVSFVRRNIDFVPSSTAALLKRGVRLANRRGAISRELVLVVLEECLVALRNAEADRELVSSGASYLCQVGPLHFDKQIDRATASQMQLPSTALAFQLAFYFRLFTAGETLHADHCIGAPMPEVGKPSWRLVAMLMGGTLGADFDPQSLARRMNQLLTSHPGLLFMGWQDEGHWKEDLRTRSVG